MKPKMTLLFVLLFLSTCGSISQGADNAVSVSSNNPPQYMGFRVDNVVIDTDGLVSAANTLADSINALAQAMGELTAADGALSAAEREALLSAVSSVDKASVALAELATKIPETAQRLTDQLPEVVKNARAPIAELSNGLKVASSGIVTLTESLPQATENARKLVNATLNSALLRVTIFSVILFLLIASSLVWLMRFVYRSYLDPIATKLDALVGAPEHFANMSKYMMGTSENLLALRKLSEQKRDDLTKKPV